MKTLSKKALLLGILMFFGIGFAFAPKIDAAGFAGNAGFTWNRVSATVNISKTNISVNWQASNHPDHKMWFGVYQNGAQKGQKLFSYLQSTSISISSTVGVSGHLAAHREHLGNPSTYVTGTWLP